MPPTPSQRGAALRDDVLLEVPLRSLGVGRYALKLASSGLLTVGDLRVKQHVAAAILPQDVITALVERIAASSASSAASTSSRPGTAASASASANASLEASPFAELLEDVAARDPLFAELKAAEASLLSRLRYASQLLVDGYLAPGNTPSTVGCTGRPQASLVEQTRRLVDTCKAHLALVRSGLKTLSELRHMEAANPVALRRGRALEAGRVEAMTALKSRLNDVLEVVAQNRDKWRESPDEMLGFAPPKVSKAGVPAYTLALEQEVESLRALLALRRIDASGIPRAQLPIATPTPIKKKGATTSSAIGGAPPDPATIRNHLGLPLSKSADDTAKRDKWFRDFDPNGNGYLSLAEIEKGVRDVVKEPKLYAAKPVMLLAYNAARSTVKRDTDLGGTTGAGGVRTAKAQASLDDDFVQRTEFRVLLLHMARFYDAWVVFSSVLAAAEEEAERHGGTAEAKKAGEGSGDAADGRKTKAPAKEREDFVGPLDADRRPHAKPKPAADADHADKYLSRDELGWAWAVLVDEGLVTAADDVGDVFHAMNPDGSANVTFREFLQWLLQAPGFQNRGSGVAAAPSSLSATPPPQVQRQAPSFR